MSYHDVVVFVNGQKYEIANHYGIMLTCTRAGGWELWDVSGGAGEKQIGGEYSGNDFRIEVKGFVICQSDAVTPT